MIAIPQEIFDLIIEQLIRIDPFLCAKISKYCYYKAMPKIWGEVNLNKIVKRRSSHKYSGIYSIIARLKERAYSFYNIYVKKETALNNVICLQFITKLELPHCFYTGVIVNILKKCPNVEEIDFSKTKEKNVPYEAIVRYCPKIKKIYIGNHIQHNTPEDWLYNPFTDESLDICRI